MGPGESCIRLFLSVDLVGSTALKSDKATDVSGYRYGPPWVNIFTQFYSGFPRVFDQTLDNTELKESLRPRLVKTIGDEILLQTKIENSSDARSLVRFFAKALAHYTAKNLASERLQLKGTAWIAGFPINNHRLFLSDHGQAAPADFIGPSIDTGFRIAKSATPTKLVVSVDLAVLLVTPIDDALDLYVDGTQTLRGVLGGKPYPIIWYKVPGADAKLHEAEIALGHRQDKTQIQRYCEAYLESCNKSWLIRPYFAADSEFAQRPDWHERILQTLVQVDARNELDFDETTELAGK